jgi:hypothetical protein
MKISLEKYNEVLIYIIILFLFYNIIGKKIATLFNDEINTGTYTFNTSNLPSGIYFYNLSGNNFTETKKMILMK